MMSVYLIGYWVMPLGKDYGIIWGSTQEWWSGILVNFYFHSWSIAKSG
jgi:hypothetical protein